MNKFGYANSVCYVNLDEYFSTKEKNLFLKIPHKIISHGKIDVIDFDVPQNGKYSLLRNVKMVKVKEELTQEELYTRGLSSLLYKTNNFKGEIGLFIQGDQGYIIPDLLEELYKHDKKSANIMLEEYFTNSIQCKDIINISDMFVRQVQQMKDYLKKENIIVYKSDLDYIELSNKFDKLDEDEAYSEILKLREHSKSCEDFPAYNDLDYTPMILDGDYCIYDSSGARLFIVKEDSESQKIYMISRDRRDITTHLNEWLHDFICENYQHHIALKNTLVESDFIAEIKNGKLIKSSIKMQTMNLLQSFIVNELIQEGKIIDSVLDLSFKELLENYTRQNEFYGIEERCILPLLDKLIIINNKVTYTNFSLMPNTKEIKHENILDSSVENFLDKDKNSQHLSYLYNKLDLTNLSNLSNDYKNQIKIYLNELLERDSSENAKILGEGILNSLNTSTIKKLKP